ncbi:preprotein translocase subunit SecE [Candidatus Kaiserbacteria bacterium CG_4_9_14_0_2_um_filter_41_32]|uniref:Protein translocase subunit SecE n=1 Tax=Candidatus Kaiserbacteria bacterium CG_4_9_14_0_2_um_filter_41_32 TaxID=1974601 RepID=A0A2M8FFC4_9BACT|nr:MAG: preprotein translocase subunit SecE [Candidatus Kaiserbacteria bacterium CG_4_9_14_0_2_um_filter_41_32]
MEKLTQYFRDTFRELKQVRWPTQNQALIYTLLVIAISLFVGLFVGSFDFIFSSGVDFIINRL